MLKSEAAAYLAGVTQTEGAEASAPTNLHVITGEVGEASADGKTLVKIDGLMFSESDDQFIEVDALGGLEEGDIATIVLTGEQGHAMTPLALGSIGSVDRITVRIAAIEADYIKVEQLDAAEARIGDLEADHVSVDDLNAATARIGTLETTRATITDLEAATARIHSLEVDHVTVDNFEAATARIGDLEADHVSTDDLDAATGRIGQLEADTADIDTIRANSAKVQNLTAAQLEADHATIGSLSTTYATIANLNAANGRITNLESTKANISDLEADYITADEIEATYMHANMSNSDVAWIENGTIKNGAIVSAMINDVSANKLTAGTINGSVINVTNLNADNITTGTINGQRIGEGSLSLDKLSEDVYTEAEVNDIVDGLNDRIDGAIETHTGTAVPTLNNSPASSWNTTALRDEHVGDVYYVVNSQSQQNGYCYRFTKSGSTYSWQLIKDSDVTAALSRLTTAEGKITSIESFDSTVSSFMTNTDSELTSVKSRATSLETRMTDAEGDISEKVDTSTFNSLSQTVDTNTASITSLSSTVSQKADGSTVTALTNRVSTVEQDVDGIETSIGELQTTVSEKADSSTVTTVSNKLNTVSDTVDGHTQTLTSVQNTLSTKADSSTVSTLSTKVNNVSDTVDGHTQTISGQSTILSNNGLTSSTNITSRVSSVEQDLSGYKTTVSETYATQTALATTNGNVTAAQTAADNAQAAADKANGRQVAYSATSSTGASTAAKVAACTNFPALAAGATVTVRFSTANTSTGAVTLNVNSTGAKTVYVNGAATSSSNQLLWGANANITFTYDGSYWRVDSEPRTWYGTGAVAAATAAKTATINEVVICKGTTVVLNMTNENTSTSATLNVTSTGAKNIYYGTTTTRPTTANGYGWSAGSTVSLTFDGQYWRIGDTTALSRITAAESTISSHTTSISQNASAIALKADSSTTYTKTDVDGLISTEVTNRNAAITAKANEITSSVSETYTTKEEFNNLEIGGRNLALNTAGVIIDRTESPDGSRYEYSYFDLGRALPFGAGTPIVISFDLYMPIKSGSPRFLVYNSNRKGPHQTLFDVDVLSGKNLPVGSIVDERIVIKTSVYADRSDSTLPNDYLEFYSNYGSNNFYRISNLKLEKGNKATEWTPAPEDIETRVSSAESSISQNAQNIELKVSKDGVISSINQSAESVKIQASKVEIDGTAIFSAISSDVDDAITDKGYATTGQVSAAKSEAISSANSATDTKLASYSTTAQANNLYDAKGAAAAVETNSGNLFLGASMTDRSTFINNSNTDFSRHFRYYNGSASIHSFSEYSPGVYQDTVTLNNSSNLGIAFARMADEMGLDSTSSYTITCWAKCSKAGMNLAIGLSYYKTSNSWMWRGGTNATAFSAADTWQKFSLTFKPDADTKAICYCFTVAGGTGSETFTIRNCWLEKNAAYDAQTTANNAAPKTNAVKRTQRIWYRTNASGAPSTPGTASSNWVTKADDGNDAWTKMHIAINSTHKYIYTCEQYEMANGTVGYTSVLLDNTITVIDGGNIITGTVTANKLNAANINASKTLTIGAMTDAAAATILNSNVVVGGRNLLRGTSTMTAGDGRWDTSCTFRASGGALSNVTTSGLPIRGVSGALRVTNTGSSAAQIGFAQDRVEGLLTGETYTQGAWVRASTTINVFHQPIYKDASRIIKGAPVSIGTDWTYISYTGTLTGTQATDFYSAGYMYAQAVPANGWFEVCGLKLEKGNKATDWTPAPEDMATAESLAGTNESLEGAITDIGELSDQLVGTISEQNKTITTIQTYLNSLRQDLDAEIQSRQQWLNFNSAEGLVIGAAGSSFKTVTTNTSQQFKNSGTVLAETSGTEFVAPVMRSDQILIGNWMWTRRDNGNLSLKWIG